MKILFKVRDTCFRFFLIKDIFQFFKIFHSLSIGNQTSKLLLSMIVFCVGTMARCACLHNIFFLSQTFFRSCWCASKPDNWIDAKPREAESRSQGGTCVSQRWMVLQDREFECTNNRVSAPDALYSRRCRLSKNETNFQNSWKGYLVTHFKES